MSCRICRWTDWKPTPFSGRELYREALAQFSRSTVGSTCPLLGPWASFHKFPSIFSCSEAEMFVASIVVKIVSLMILQDEVRKILFRETTKTEKIFFLQQRSQRCVCMSAITTMLSSGLLGLMLLLMECQNFADILVENNEKNKESRGFSDLQYAPKYRKLSQIRIHFLR